MQVQRAPVARLTGIISLLSALGAPAFSEDAVSGVALAANESRWATIHFHNTETVEEARKLALSQFDQANLDGKPGLSKQDRQHELYIVLASVRARLLGSLLSFDLNGDMAISTQELEVFGRKQAKRPLRGQNNISFDPTPEQQRVIVDAFVQDNLKGDTNADGRVSAQELREYVTQQALVTSTKKQNGKSVFALFPDRLEVITRDEFLRVVDRILAIADIDDDGQLSQEERNNIRRFVKRDAQLARTRTMTDALLKEKCEFGKIPDNADVYVVGGYEGAALSTVRLGREGSVTRVAEIVIPAKETPAFMILGFFEPTIVQFSGATDRIMGAIHLSASAGFTGVTRKQLIRMGSRRGSRCNLKLWQERRANEPSYEDLFETALGRAPAKIVRAYTLSKVDLNADPVTVHGPMRNEVELDVDGAAAEVWQLLKRFEPRGVVNIKADDVISLSEVAPYQVMPQEAGLAKLVEEGALIFSGIPPVEDQRKADPYGKVKIGSKTFVPKEGDDLIGSGGLFYAEEEPGLWVGRKRSTFLVVKEMTFPAGLNGAHSYRFVVPDGVPDPKGNPGHSKVVPQKW